MPAVSVIVPCYNEEKTIALLLNALYAQTYPRDQMEVIIADGLSEDTTRAEITAFVQQHPDLSVQVVNNQARTIPAGLNLAIAAARGDFVVRLDAHSAPRPDFIERSVAALQAGLGDNVGGVWEIRPADAGWVAQSIALAAAHPLGVGDALYRFTARAQAVDTVPFGAFDRALIDRIGAFNEDLLTNEDYEFNHRLRQAGGTVWLDPAIRSIYYARPTFGELARQYWRYGYWKARMLRRYPASIRWRQALPPLFVLSLLLLPAATLIFRPAGGLLTVEVVSYGLILLAVGAQLAWRERSLAPLIGVPLAIVTMHLSWGAAFIWSALTLASGDA